ncbi:MAG: glycosyltransferase family 4 protein [Planctomycetes bacterium]|nr:glycosyltransferase family 4 protein [Planctomycetota bacterium]
MASDILRALLTVALDYRPALFQGFGIGRYVRNLVPALLDADPELALRLYGVFWRNRKKVLAGHDWPDPSRARFCGAPIPARLVPLIGRLRPSSAKTVTGPVDVLHDTDYAVTPVRGAPRIATLYDTAYLHDRGFVSEMQSRHMHEIVKRLLKGVTRVITISEFAKQDLVEAFDLDPAQVSVTYLGVDPVFHQARSQDEIESALETYGITPPYCMYLGTLEPRKNLVRLVRAFARVLEVAPEHHLVLVGRKGWAHERVFGVVQELGIGDHVRWLGQVPDSEAALLLKGAAVMAYPSLYEGFGLPALEGMAAGVPVLASDSHALREVCGDGALLVDPYDEDAIYEGLRMLALDRGEAHEIADRGRRRAAKFTWKACGEATVAAYRAVVEGA